MRRLADDAQAPLDPLLEEDAPPLPGTGSRAFWIGLIVVSLSLVSGLATYLILTGLTPIVPRNEVVLGVLFINLLLVIAMVVVIAVQAVGLAARLAQEGGGRPPACAHRRAVQPHHGAAGAAAGGRRHHHVLALARQLVQPPDHRRSS